MKSKIILGVIFLALLGAAFYLFQHQKKLNFCKDQCTYIAPRDPDNGGRLYKDDKGDYWIIGSRKFETQGQCLDYCVSVK
jgi:hypothetical protein